MPQSAASRRRTLQPEDRLRRQISRRHAGRLLISAPDRTRTRRATHLRCAHGRKTPRGSSRRQEDIAALSPDGQSRHSSRPRREEPVFVAMNGGEARRSRTRSGSGNRVVADGKRIACSARGDYVETRTARAANATVRASSATSATSWTASAFRRATRPHLRCRRRVRRKRSNSRAATTTMTSRRGAPTARPSPCVGPRARAQPAPVAHRRLDGAGIRRAAKKLTRALGSAATNYSPDGKWIAYVGHEHGDEAWRRTRSYVRPIPRRHPDAITERIDRPVLAGVVRVWPHIVCSRLAALLFLRRTAARSHLPHHAERPQHKYSPATRDRNSTNAARPR